MQSNPELRGRSSKDFVQQKWTPRYATGEGANMEAGGSSDAHALTPNMTAKNEVTGQL